MASTIIDRLDGYTGNVSAKAPVRVATTGAIALYGLQTIDSIAVAAGDRVLVKNQADTKENGIYRAAPGDWVRAPDFDGALDVVGGTYIPVQVGTTNANTYWRVVADGKIMVGSDDIVIGPSSGNIDLQVMLAAPGGIALVGGLDSLARTAVMGTLADAKTSNVLVANPNAQFIHIAERKCSFQRWQAPMVTLPDTLEDYAWFTDAGGNLWMIPPGSANVLNFGEVSSDATATTRTVFAAAAWCSSGYCHHLIFPNLGEDIEVKDGQLAWYPTGAAKTEMTSMSGFSGTNCGIAFIGIDGLTLVGEGAPMIKRADNGCSINTSSWLSWGIFNFKSCTNVKVLGINFDGNRLGQLHTSGLGTFTDTNHGLFFWGDCQKPTVAFCDFYNTGTLHTNADKSGDGIYMSSGTKDRLITRCNFYTMGRMAVTMERPRPNTSTDDSTTRSSRDEISYCVVDNGFNQDGAVALAGIDFEPWSTFGYVRIHHCTFKGSAKLSIGSAANVALQTVRHIHIHDCVFDLTGSTGAHDSDVLINISAGWTNPSLSLSQAVRIYEGVTIEDIDVYSDKKLGGHIIQFQTAVFRDLTVRNIRNHARDSTVNAVSAIQFTNVWLEGTIELEDNQTGQLTQGIYFGSFTSPTDYGYTPEKSKMFVCGNKGNGTSRGLRGALPAFVSGSSIVLSRNRFLDQASQSDPNASTMVGVSGNTAKVLDDNYFSGTANSFTGFTTPGRGTDTIAAGTSSKVVTHGLGYTPANVQITPKGDITPATYWWADTFGSNTFTIHTNANVTSATDFSWRAVGPGGL
ncbi:hypothetical protein [Rhizorhabdus wittichii]|uniref:hypothetical protein n=1 Tax=Rhizorhabdus wittichii TaxID=160791 RepID=UPI00035FAF1F|nr:hypothetical protein [Rhizorhabdus wittichii]